MSRYEKNLGEETLSVGWDRPMNTFFAQVHTNQSENDLRDLPVVLWMGANFDEFTDLKEFERDLENQGYQLGANIFCQLRRDQLGSTQYDANLLIIDGFEPKL